MDTILSEIEAFLDAHGMAAATFGALARNDRHLVRQLRAGRRLWPETATEIRKFMATYRPAPKGKAA